MKARTAKALIAAALLVGLSTIFGCSPSAGGGPDGGNGTPPIPAQWAQTLTAGGTAACFNHVAVDSSGNSCAAGFTQGTSSFGFGNGKTASGTSTSYNPILVAYNSSGQAQWAQSSTGTSGGIFYSSVIAGSGNVYAAGTISMNTSMSFGGTVSAAGANSAGDNLVLVKYNSSGQAQWAQTAAAGTSLTANSSAFYAVAVDGSENLYAAGSADALGGSYNLGNSVSVSPTATYTSTLLVKYNSSGQAQWAAAGGGSSAVFYCVAVDPSSGSIYAAGRMSGTSSYSFGNSVTAAGTDSTTNVLLVKYNSSGVAQWARTQTAGSGSYGSQFTGLAVDGSGNVYVAGFDSGSGTYGFGNGVQTAGNGFLNALVVKYDSTGQAQWAQSVTGSAFTATRFYGVASDAAGNLCAGGYSAGTVTYSFGNGITAKGSSSGGNVLLVKYNSMGQAQGAATFVSGGSSQGGTYYSVGLDGSSRIYAAGSCYGGSQYGFGSNVTVAGAIINDNNVLLVKY